MYHCNKCSIIIVVYLDLKLYGSRPLYFSGTIIFQPKYFQSTGLSNPDAVDTSPYDLESAMDNMSLKEPEPTSPGTPKRFADMVLLSASTLELPGKTPDDEASGSQMLSNNFNIFQLLSWWNTTGHQDMFLFLLRCL